MRGTVSRQALALDTGSKPTAPQTVAGNQPQGPQAAAGMPSVDLEVLRHEAWAQERHDLEMRTTALILEIEHALRELDGLLERYVQVMAARATFEPPIREEGLLPAEFVGSVRAVRQRLHASRPDLFPS